MSTRSRKYQLTINNPDDFGITHETINNAMKSIKWIYYCFGDEIGADEHTPHIHLYFCCKDAISFDKVKKLFPTAHIEACKGTSQDNRDYIRKEGRHSDKSITSVPDTFEEYGELPDDTVTKNETVSADVLNMIMNGCSNAEIVKLHPSYLSKISHIENTRNMLNEDKYKNMWRDVVVYYIFGETGSGKTRYVMEKYGYENVYKVTNYLHPFDNYCGQDILLLDEFRSSIPISEMLQYLDGYPCQLSARYNNKWACYSKVYIVSNLDLDRQYPNIQFDDEETYNAFIRRINFIVKFEKDFSPIDENGDFNYYILPDNYILGD